MMNSDVLNFLGIYIATLNYTNPRSRNDTRKASMESAHFLIEG